nr:MAG TPA_asm: hypothetical protein [Caudoviricetes sp.]
MQRNVASWRERSAVCCLRKNYGYLGFLVKNTGKCLVRLLVSIINQNTEI